MARYNKELSECCETIAELFEELALNFKQLLALVQPEDEDASELDYEDDHDRWEDEL